MKVLSFILFKVNAYFKAIHLFNFKTNLIFTNKLIYAMEFLFFILKFLFIN